MSAIKIRYFYGPSRPKPKAGDRRTTKKHGEQVRIPQQVPAGHPHAGAFVVRSGRPCYEWVSITDPRAVFYIKSAAPGVKETS